MAFYLLLLYIFMAFIRPHEYIELFIGVPVTLVILVSVAIASLLTIDKNKISDIFQVKLLILILVSIFLSNFVKHDVDNAIIQITKFFPIAILSLLIVKLLTDVKKINYYIFIIIICSVVISIHGIFQIQTGIGWTGVGLVHNRISYLGIFHDPNDLGMLLVITIPMLIYFRLLFTSLVSRMMVYGAITINLYGLYLTNSRGSILALFAMMGVYIKEKYGIYKFVVLVIILSPFAYVLPSRMSTVSVEESSAAGRVEAWYQGLQMFFAFPFTGIGAGRFIEFHHLTAHNSFILVIAELGMFGYFFWFMMMAYTFSLISHARKTYAHNSNKNLVLALNMFYFSYIGLFVTMFFLSRSYSIILYIYLFLTISFYKILLKDGYQPQVDHYIYVRYFGYSVASIILFYIFVKVLVLMT